MRPFLHPPDPAVHAVPACARRWRRTGRRVLSGAALVVLLGCSAMPMAPGTARADGSAPFDGELMYELMIAELAGRRGRLDLATEGYLAAAERSEDARVADRAARLAMFGSQWPEAERAARRWIALDGEAHEAREVLARALLRQGEDGAAMEAYVALVAMAPPTDDTDGAGADGGDPVPGDRVSPTRAATLHSLSAAFQEEDPSRMAPIAQALASAYPQEAEAHLGVARLALATDEHQRVLEAVDAALARDPGNADAQLLRARALLASDRENEAFDGLEAALASAPDDVPLRLGQARLLAEAGRTESALVAFERLHELAPEEGDVLLTIGLLAFDAGRADPARRYLESLLETGNYTDQANFYLARIDEREDDPAAAIGRFEAVRPGPLYADARIRAAELHALGGALERGRERLRDLALEFPDPTLAPRLVVAEGRMLQRAKESEEAVAVLSEGLQRFPENTDLLYARALAADGAGDPETLERDLERLIELQPDNAHALNALGYHLADADRRLDEAEVYLEKAIALEPDDAAILDSLGWLRYRQGRLEEAVELLREAHARYPDGEIAAHLGEVLWVQGKREEAQAVWEKALVETPDDDVLQRVVKKFTAE